MHDSHRAPLPPRLSLLATLSVLITAVGCEPGGRQPAAPAEPPARLTLDTVAIVHSDLLYFVEDVKRGPDGLFVVLNLGPTEVLLLNEAGDLMGTVGRLGEGPGEFQSLLDLDTKGDSILLLDGAMRRVLLFHRESPVATWSLRDLPETPLKIAFGAGGAPVVSVERDPGTGLRNVMQVLRDTIEFYRVDDPGTPLETPIKVPGGERFVLGNPTAEIKGGMPAFAAHAQYDLVPTGVVAADARDGRVVSFDWDGQTARILRPASPLPAVSEAEMDALWERVEARVSRDPGEAYLSRARQSVEVWDGTVPRPFYAAVISDGSEILVGHYVHRWADIVEWSLLDRNGTVGTFTLEEGIRLFSLHDREILAVGRDSMDVEHLLVLRIVSPPTPPQRQP